MKPVIGSLMLLLVFLMVIHSFLSLIHISEPTRP